MRWMRFVQPPYKIGGDTIGGGVHRYQNLDYYILDCSTQESPSSRLGSVYEELAVGGIHVFSMETSTFDEIHT